MAVLGIILARAGSRGLPHKHTRDLCGKPVISYTFAHALAARTLTHIAVSTNITKVRALAEAAGIEAVRRPAHMARDMSPVEEALRHATLHLERRHGVTAELIVTLYGNVPLRRKGIIDRVVRHARKTGADMVRTYIPVGKYNPYWMLQIRGDHVTPFLPKATGKVLFLRQKLPMAYLHDGAVDVITRQALFNTSVSARGPFAMPGEDLRAVLQKPTDTVEIDRAEDLVTAESLLRQRSRTP